MGQVNKEKFEPLEKGEEKMQEMERIEELKRSMMRKVNNREEMPEEVIRTIQEAFNELLNIYRDLHSDNLAIQQYIEGSLGQVKVDVTRNLGKKCRESQLRQVQDICGRIERELEDVDRQIDEPKKEEVHKQEISQIESGEQHMATRIVVMLEDSLRSVQSKQNRILSSHGDSMEKIEQVQQNAREFIRYFISRNEGKIYGILKKDNDSLKEQLLREYEEYQLQVKQDDARKEEGETKESKRKEFVDKLDGDISLEAQRDFSEKYTAESKSKEEMDKKRNRRFTGQYFGIRRKYGGLYIREDVGRFEKWISNLLHICWKSLFTLQNS